MLNSNFRGKSGVMLDATSRHDAFFEGMPKATKWLVICANLLGLVLVVWGIKTSFAMNAVGDHSLWLDEASLVQNYFVKSFGEIASTVPANMQAAPLLYMWLQKLLVTLCGGSEYVLRIYSVLSYASTLFLVAYIMIRILKSEFGFLAAAFVANIPYVLRYSIVAKPYMSEAAWALIILIIYDWYRREPVCRLVATSVMLMVCIAFSNSACFMIGGCLAIDFLVALFDRDHKQIKNSFSMGALICAFFALYYLLFLRLGSVQPMRHYWQNYFFDILPMNKAALVRDHKLLSGIMNKLQHQMIVVILCILSLFFSLTEQNKLILSVWAGFLVALFASYITMWPVIDRLWIFAYPMTGILVFYSIERIILDFHGRKISESSKIAFLKYAVTLVAMLLIVFSNHGIGHYQNRERVYWWGEESSKLVEYVQSHIKGNEKVYVWGASVASVKYKIGYTTNRIGNVNRDNIIWPTFSWGWAPARAKSDAESINNALRCWIITSHVSDARWYPLKTELEKLGILSLAYSFHGTNLYYFTSNDLTETTRLDILKPAFSSQYQLNGQEFVSGTGPRFLAVGPNMTLSSGSYIVTYHYADQMKEKGKTIGYVDFLAKGIRMRHGQNRSEYSSDIRSGETVAHVEFMLEQPAERAQFRMYTTVPGVTFKSVTIRRRKTENAEEVPAPSYFAAQRRLDYAVKRARIDIKNRGADNAVVVENTSGNAKLGISYPKWFTDKSGVGCVTVDEQNTINLKLSCQKDGELFIAARGMDVRKASGDKHRVKVLVTYTSIKLDGEELLKAPFDAWHDQPFTYRRKVKDGQALNLVVAWKPYHYTKEQIDQLVKELQ